MLTVAFALCWYRKQLEELEEAGMLRGELTSTQQLALLSSYDDLAQALEGAFFVQVIQLTTPSTCTCQSVCSSLMLNYYRSSPSHIRHNTRILVVVRLW